MNLGNTQSDLNAASYEQTACCTRCYEIAPLSSLNTWHDAATGQEQRHCDACAALTTCGLCRTEGNAKDYRTILIAGEFVMDVCRVCDSVVLTAHA
jgi:hypothetical protein